MSQTAGAVLHTLAFVDAHSAEVYTVPSVGAQSCVQVELPSMEHLWKFKAALHEVLRWELQHINPRDS